MEVFGVCAVCAAPANRTCILCGKGLCDEHVNSRGVCVFCAGGKSRGAQAGKSTIAHRRKGARTI